MGFHILTKIKNKWLEIEKKKAFSFQKFLIFSPYVFFQKILNVLLEHSFHEILATSKVSAPY